MSQNEIREILRKIPSRLEEVIRLVREGFSSRMTTVTRRVTECIDSVNAHDRYVESEARSVDYRAVSFIWITGEEGVGKRELVRRIKAECLLREYHLDLDCELVPDDRIEPALFGHRTEDAEGWTADGSGKLSKAEAGILSIHRPQQMPPRCQQRLLAWHDAIRLRPLRDDLRDPDPDPLVVFVARESPEELVRTGRVLRRLFTKSFARIHVPPLRERPKDVVLLMEHFLCEKRAEFSAEFSLVKNLNPEPLWVLVNFHWPGNVRALREVFTRLVADYLVRDHNRVLTLAEVVAALKTQYGEKIVTDLTPSFRRGALPSGQRHSGKKRFSFDEILVFRGLIDMGWHLDDVRQYLGLSRSQMSRTLGKVGAAPLQLGRPRTVYE